MKRSFLKISIKYICALAILLTFSGVCFGASGTTWKGTTSSDWNTASNWSSGVPTSSVGATIGGGTYQPTLSTTAAAGTYQCASLTVGSNATLTISSGYKLNIVGALTINSGVSFNVSGTGTLLVGGTYNNYGTTAFGSGGSAGSVTFSGSYTDNNSPTTFGTDLVTFSAPSSNTTNSIQIVPSDVLTFTNLTFTVGKFQLATGTHNTGSFALTSTGVLTFMNGAQLQVTNAYGFTFYSDANGSATLAAIPAGCGFKGAAKYYVQRFIKGSSSDLSKRGYRLMSSSVYTGTDVNAANANVYDFQYLLSSVYVSGLGNNGGGFNVPLTQNPSLYLFREDDPPPPTSSSVFTTAYNWKGVAKINNTIATTGLSVYQIGTQKRNTHTNTNDTTTTIPVGNGFLMLFRGDNTHTANYTYPYGTSVQDVTLTESGTINTGTINVRLWFANTGNNLGNNLSYTYSTTALATGSTSALTGGFALVGNPYPSTINWEKFNANATVANSSIYGGGGLTGTIYTYDVLTKQYDSYIPLGGGADTLTERPAGSSWTGSASNMIASGQGFFVQADKTGESLSFRETAKTNTQPTAANLQALMGKPVATTIGPKPLLRLRLVKDSINHDEIVIRLGNNFNPKYIPGEDALDLGGSSAPESLSAFSSDSVKLAISSMPFPGKQQETIRLLADATASGTYQFNRTQLDNLPQLYAVWLKDSFTGDSVNLRTTATYSFQIDKTNPATFGSNRFTVVISQDPAYAYRLLSFTAARVGNSSNVETHWTTANEQNYTNFTVERSTDGGKTFAVVGGMWGTGAGDYGLMDKNAAIGTNLYRLKSEDINNTITYSNIATVVITQNGNSNADALHVYPNPATSIINLDVKDNKGNTSYNIVVSNSTGFIVKQAISSQPNWQASVSDLMPGTYLVRVTNNKTQNFVGESKFVKL